MAKTPKKIKEATTPEANPERADPKPQNGAGNARTVNPTVAKKPLAKGVTGTKSPRSRSVTPRKSSAARKPLAAAVACEKQHGSEHSISDESIRMRAYFIAEGRIKSGVAGDSAHDWLEARRQLQAEAQQQRA